MMKELSSIRLKVVALYLILLTIALVFAGFFLQNALKSYFSQWIDKRLTGEMNLMIRLTKPLIREDDSAKLDQLVAEYGEKLETRITIIARDGLVLADSRGNPSEMDNHLQRPEVQAALEQKIAKKTRYSKTLDLDMKYIAIPIREQGSIIGIMRFALDLTKLRAMYKGIWLVLLQAGIIIVLISIVLSLKFASNITTPLENMTNLAEKISQGSLNQKIRVKTNDEIGRLASMFNQMVDQIKSKIRDISNEKSKIEAIVSNIGDGIIAVDLNKKIILINLAARNIFSVEDEVLGKPLLNITQNYKLEELIEESLRTQQSIIEEIELLLPAERIFRIRLAPIIRNKKTTGIVVSLRDITDMRQLQQMRTEFVSNVSHELRTPLTSIKGYVETLLETKPEKEIYQNFLEIIADETNRLELLIDDILNLSKIESGAVELEENVDVEQVMNNLLSLLNLKAEEAEIDLKLLLEDDLPLITGNYNQLSRMMINLVDNAIKYTESGGTVIIRAQAEESRVIIEVEDNGLGIPHKDLSRIFERFYRVDKGRSRQLGGTGLGLSIVKHIVENHQGQIKVESELERGTKFIITLPFG
ncbi:MAG: two-component system histidine kinase PnpS [Bacillota bacterium]